MTTLATKLYATQNNGGSPSVSIQDIGNLLSSAAVPATTSVAGVVKQAVNVSALTDNTGGAVSSTLAAITVASTLTDSTGGSVSTTLAAITAGASYAQADLVAVKNGIASIAAIVNTDTAQVTVVKNAIASLSAKVDALLSALITSGALAGP